MKSKRAVTLFPALSTILVGPCGTALAGTEPSPWHTTSLRTDISGDALVDPPDPGCDADTVPLTGQLDVATRLRVSDAGGLSGDVYLNLHGVEGIDFPSGQRYLGLGAAQVQYPPDPGSPQSPFTVNFVLRGVGLPPSPCMGNPGPPDDQALPASVELLFDPDAVLTGVNASIQRIGVGQ